MMQLPAIILSVLFIALYGAVFHLWQGRTVRDLVFFWLAAAVGFASGQVVGQLLDFIPWSIGQVHIIEATLVAVLFLFMARWLRQEAKLS